MRKKKEGDSQTTPITFETKMNLYGNWNHKNKDLQGIYSKPIGITIQDGDEFSWKHHEIFELIKLFHEVDEESIKMIEDPNIDTGEVKFIEKPFINKLKEEINKLEENEK